MLEKWRILELADTLKREIGVSCEVQVLDKKKADKMKIGEHLLNTKNLGVRFEGNAIYILQEKMIDEDKCIFSVSQQLCRRWIFPKTRGNELILEKTIKAYYSHITPDFRTSLYNLLSTSWILNYSTIPTELKDSYVRFLRILYKPSSLKNVDNSKDRKILNKWELFYRLQNLLVDDFYNILTDDSVVNLNQKHKKKMIDLLSSIKNMSDYFWRNYQTALGAFNDFYLEFEYQGHDDDEREKQDIKSESSFDAGVFYDKCKSSGIDDIVIKNYFDRLSKLGVRLVNMGANKDLNKILPISDTTNISSVLSLIEKLEESGKSPTEIAQKIGGNKIVG